MNVILYSTNCPMCKVLEKKLIHKDIAFDEINDVEVMRSKGFLSAPMLEVDGNIMNFKEAIDWINSL